MTMDSTPHFTMDSPCRTGPTLAALVVALVLALPAGAAEDDSWKINLKNADIKEFITQISAITGKSFIVDPRVKGQVTVISNVSLNAEATYELFQSVLRVHGFAAVPAGDVIKIVQQVLAKQSANTQDFQDDASGEGLVTRVIPVRNTAATELVKILRPLIPQYGHVAGLVTPNALIINDHADNILRIIDIVERVDVADTSSLMIMQLNDAWVEDMVALLEKLAPEEIGRAAKGPNSIKIVANERTNSLVFKGEEKTLARIKDLVERLDQPASRSGSIQVVRLAHSDATEMAELLKNLVSQGDKENAQSPQDVEFSVQADESLNALVIRANPTTMAEVKDIIASLDVRRTQVLIEAAIVEVTTDFEQQLGSELALADTSSSSLPLGLTAPSGTLASVLQSLAVGSVPTNVNLGDAPLLSGGRGDPDGFNFAFIIRALSQNSDVNLLSTPSIMTMDNQEAKIIVGQSVPFRTGSTVTGSSGATNPFTTITREDVGLTLEVVPHVHDGDLVRLEVRQEVSEVDSLQNIGASGSADLITNKRTIETTVLADNEEVIVLGGLIRDKTTNSENKVPMLGSIPVVGRLFKSSAEKHEKQNLLVFLRPSVLTKTEDLAAINDRKFTGVWDVEIEGLTGGDAMKSILNGN